MASCHYFCERSHSRTEKGGLTSRSTRTRLRRTRNAAIGCDASAGLEHLKGLTKLGYLNLWSTKVTDAGLVHLEGLTNLKGLNLRKTQVTDAGVEKLQQALPKCKIRR